MKKIINYFYIICFVLVLIAGLAKTILKPSDFNYTENRDSNKMPAFNIKSYIDNSFQSNFEKALSDQIIFSQKMKKVTTSLQAYPIVLYSKTKQNLYTRVNKSDIYIYQDYLVYNNHDTHKSANFETNLTNKITSYNDLANKYDDIDFYLYYIERDEDIDLETGRKLNIYNQITSILSNKIKNSRFEINTFEDIKNYFYVTDHHWNHKGSYKGYTELVDLLDINDNPVKIDEEVCPNTIMTGSKSVKGGVHLLFNESFCAYKFKLKKHDIYINGKKRDEYGTKYYVYNNLAPEIKYGEFYGFDLGLVHFDYHDSTKQNILVAGESFDNAIVEILASHFNNTYSIDLRAYETDMKEKFDFDKFVKEHNINKVLMIGNVNYFEAKLFDLKVED